MVSGHSTIIDLSYLLYSSKSVIAEVARQQGIGRFLVGTLSKQTDEILRFYRSHGFTPWLIRFFR